MKNKRQTTGLIVIAAVILLVAVFVIVPMFNKGIQTLGMLGGGPTFGTSNTQMAEYNKSELNTKITILDESHLTDYKGDWSKVDLVQAGSVATINDLRNLPAGTGPAKIYGEIVMSTSPNMIWVKSNVSQDDLKPLIDAGYVYTKQVDGRTVYLIDPDKLTVLVRGAVDNKEFNDTSINVAIDSKINIGFPNSSGGRTSAAQLLACYFNNCDEMVTSEAIVVSKDKDGKDVYDLAPEFEKALIALYERSGKQPADEYSVDYCYNWLNQKTASVHLSIFPESCYAAWAITNANSADLMKEKGNVGIYITKTVVNTFTLIAVSEEGKAYIDALANNADFSRVVAESTGMRGAGIVSIPPTSVFGDFIAPNEPFQQITFPFSQLTSAIKKELNDYGK